MILCPGKCVNCGAELKPIGPQGEECHQYEDSMDLTLCPGYGERFDGDVMVRFTVGPCCSDNLLAILPGLRDQLEATDMFKPDISEG